MHLADSTVLTADHQHIAVFMSSQRLHTLHSASVFCLRLTKTFIRQNLFFRLNVRNVKFTIVSSAVDELLII